MTNGPTTTPPPRNEGEYARKLALAILSTLESKGLLTQLDVDTILHAAYRSANAAPTTPEPTPAPQPPRPRVPSASGPAALSTNWVKAPRQAEPSQAGAASGSGPTAPEKEPEPDDAGNIIIIPAPGETEAPPEEAEAKKEADKPAIKPMVIDFTLD